MWFFGKRKDNDPIIRTSNEWAERDAKVKAQKSVLEQVKDEVRAYKRVPNISEPVLSFVEIFKKNPRRFQWKLGPLEQVGKYQVHKQIFRDKVLGIDYYFNLETSTHNYRCLETSEEISYDLFSKYRDHKLEEFRKEPTYPRWFDRDEFIDKFGFEYVSHVTTDKEDLNWLTLDECRYIYEEITKLFRQRLKDIGDRKEKIKRQKFIRLYCTEENT